MTTAIIDYGSGNLRSIAKSCERAAESLGETINVTNRPEEVAKADRVILPGVGAFGDCAAGIRQIAGMRDALEEFVIKKGKPFLGVCVGMQLMANKGFEHGEHEGFGWIPGEVVPIQPKDASYKIPHMGWNELLVEQPGHPVLKGITSGMHAYFVHSFHFACRDKHAILGTVGYGFPIVAALGRDNIVGTQFHPEKSQKTGLTLLTNFLTWRP